LIEDWIETSLLLHFTINYGMNISSIIVNTAPENTKELINFIKKQKDICEYHLHDDKGRIIVTIEGTGVEEEVAKMQAIQKFPLVISAEMVFAYSEDELEKNRELLDNNNTLPDWLNDPNAKVGDIKYNGDLKGRF